MAHEPEFALGSILIRPEHCELVGACRSETLEPRVIQVLVALPAPEARWFRVTI